MLKRNPTAFIELTLIFKQEENLWTAECEELGTAAFGDTFEEAHEALEDLVTLHLNTLEDVGECDRFMKEQGIKIHRTYPKRTSLLDIPIGTLIQPEVRELACVH